MAPIEPAPTAQAESAIRDTIQSLYNVLLHTSAYDAAGPHTTLDALVAEVQVLSRALQATAAAATVSGQHGQHGQQAAGLPAVPRDLVQYVEAGRNPDIYTREFVELVRRTNQLRAGKQTAFAQFRDVLAGQIRSALPELQPDVERVLHGTGGGGGGSGAGVHGSAADTAGASTTTATADDTNTHTTLPGRPAPTSAPTSAPAVHSTVAAHLGHQNNQNNQSRSVSGSVSASASASPPVGLGGTPGSDGGGGSSTIDMLGMLPDTPQAGGAAVPLVAATSAAPTPADDAAAGNGLST